MRSISTATLAALVLAAGLVACAPVGPPPPPGVKVCVVGGKTYKPGETFPAPDGCNHCRCDESGRTACTLIACAVDGGTAPAKPCKRGGCSGQVCADEDVVTTCEFRPEYACYAKATCERQADGRCGFSKTPELESCLAAAKK